MHKQAKQPGDLGDLINGWVCGVGLMGYIAWVILAVRVRFAGVQP